jgi:hypothetical protein
VRGGGGGGGGHSICKQPAWSTDPLTLNILFVSFLTLFLTLFLTFFFKLSSVRQVSQGRVDPPEELEGLQGPTDARDAACSAQDQAGVRLSLPFRPSIFPSIFPSIIPSFLPLVISSSPLLQYDHLIHIFSGFSFFHMSYYLQSNSRSSTRFRSTHFPSRTTTGTNFTKFDCFGIEFTSCSATLRSIPTLARVLCGQRHLPCSSRFSRT